MLCGGKTKRLCIPLLSEQTAVDQELTMGAVKACCPVELLMSFNALEIPSALKSPDSSQQSSSGQIWRLFCFAFFEHLILSELWTGIPVGQLLGLMLSPDFHRAQVDLYLVFFFLQQAPEFPSRMPEIQICSCSRPFLSVCSVEFTE